MRRKHLCVCQGEILCFQRRLWIAPCCLAHSPTLVAQKLPLRMEGAVEGGWGGHSPSAPLQGRVSPGFSPGTHSLRKLLSRGTNSRSIPGWRGDCWERGPGKGKECRKREEEECPHRQGLKLRLIEMVFECEPSICGNTALPCCCSLTMVCLLIPPPVTAHGHPDTDAVTGRQCGETCKPCAWETQSWADPEPQGTYLVPVSTAQSSTMHRCVSQALGRASSLPSGSRTDSPSLEMGTETCWLEKGGSKSS